MEGGMTTFVLGSKIEISFVGIWSENETWETVRRYTYMHCHILYTYMILTLVPEQVVLLQVTKLTHVLNTNKFT